MNQHHANRPPADEFDPTYLHSLREAYVIIGLFAIFCIWSIFVCNAMGYDGDGIEQRAAVTVPMVWGMPAWVFWGIFLPWIAVDVVAVWFCFIFMKPDDLGEATSENDTHPTMRPGDERAVGETP